MKANRIQKSVGNSKVSQYYPKDELRNHKKYNQYVLNWINARKIENMENSKNNSYEVKKEFKMMLKKIAAWFKTQ